LHANLIAVLEISRVLNGTKPTTHYAFLYVKDANIIYEVHIYLCITKTYQQLREYRL